VKAQRVKRRRRPKQIVMVAGGAVRNHLGRRRLVMTVRGAATSGVTFLRRSDTLWRGLDDYYREYCRNFLVRGSIDARAFWATKEGFETVVEDTGVGTPLSEEKKAQLKAYVDRINGDVKLDSRLRLALVKAPIWGKAGFEIEFQKKDAPWLPGNPPVALHSLKSTLLAPEVDLDNWKLTGFEYDGKKGFYKPEEVLFFVRNEIDDDWQGRSDIESVLVESILDDRIIREDLMEAATTLWAGVGTVLLDLEKAAKAGITNDDDVEDIEDKMREQLKPGKWLVGDDLWKFDVHDLKPDLMQLLAVSDKLERRILGSFKVPRFLLNIEKELNRATAEKELEGFVEGPLGDDQRWEKRTVEAQWYDRLTRQFLELKPDESSAARVVHRWRQIRVEDWLNLLDEAIKGYGEGRGPLSLPKFYELMRDGRATTFDPKEVASQPGSQPVEIPLDLVARPKKRSDQRQEPSVNPLPPQ
jgi:hypothetical protein